MKTTNSILLLLLTLCFGCHYSNIQKDNTKKHHINNETLYILNNNFVDSDFSNGLIITFINGDCSYCTNRIHEHRYFTENVKSTALNYIILIYSENNFYRKDTTTLRSTYSNYPIVFDSYNLFQIKNKLPKHTEEYSIYIDNKGNVMDIGNPNILYTKYSKSI